MKPTKMRNKRIYRAVNQVVNKQISAPLSKDLRKKYSRRSVRIMVDDTAKVIRGEYKGIAGKVSKISTNNNSIAIEGNKKENQFKIGVEHEKFLFSDNKRVNFETISKIFNFLKQFGWKTIEEKNNIIALAKEGKTITLEPGNQIELSGAPLNSIHLTCNESYKFLDELKKACSSLNLKMMSTSFDPFSKLKVTLLTLFILLAAKVTS